MWMSREPEYVLLDRLTRNQLGEFDTYEEAEEAYFDFVGPHPPAAEHIEIWREDGTEPIPVAAEKIRRAAEAWRLKSARSTSG